MSSYQYRKSHCGDKTVVRSSYLHNGISYIGKTTSVYWIRAQFYMYVTTHLLILLLVISISNRGQMCLLWTWWRHEMETFSTLLAICAGNSPVIGEFPAQRPVTRSFDVYFDLLWINVWANNGEAGDFRCHCAHCDVTVMVLSMFLGHCSATCNIVQYWTLLQLYNGPNCTNCRLPGDSHLTQSTGSSSIYLMTCCLYRKKTSSGRCWLPWVIQHGMRFNSLSPRGFDYTL